MLMSEQISLLRRMWIIKQIAQQLSYSSLNTFLGLTWHLKL